ncbi:MAG TPA: hypothetical protein VJ464_22290 [Blastocatellia bacterium]|nr:hypothetical protein [Blastocatellia bacterium]
MRRLRFPLCLCAVVLLVLLMPAVPDNSRSTQPFQSVVLAGHTVPSGEECNCGCIGCFCDPGEPPICQNANRAGSDILGVSGDKSAATPDSSGDGGAVLFGALVFMAILRSLWR